MTHRAILVIGGAIALTSLLTVLLCRDLLHEWSYALLLSIVILSIIIGFGFERIREIDFKQLRITLDALREVRADIFAKEADLRHTAAILVELIAFASAWSGRLGNDEDYELRRKWIEKKSRELMTSLRAPDTDADHAFRYQRELTILDDLRGKPNRTDQLEKVKAMMRLDLDQPTPT